MSMFNYYRYSNSSYNNRFMSAEAEPSTESIGDWFKKAVESIKTLLNKIKEYIVKIGKSIYNGIVKLFEFLLKRKDKDKKITENLLTEDIIKVYRKVLTGYNGRTTYFIERTDNDKEYRVIDLDKYNKDIDTLLNYFKSNPDATELPDDIQELMNSLPSGHPDGVNIEYKDQVDSKLCSQLYKLINPNNIDTLYKQVKYDIPKTNSKLDERVRNIENEYKKLAALDSSSDIDLRDKLAILRYILKAVLNITMFKHMVYQSIIGFYRMVSVQLNNGFAFSEPCPKGMKLYHLSKNFELGHILEPRTPDSAKSFKKSKSIEILPKRISFAPEVEGCYYGMAHWLSWGDYTVNPDNEDEAYVDLRLYKAILDDESMKIKDVYMRETVADYNLTKEVALTTDTYIKKEGSVRIYVGMDKKEYNTSFGVKSSFNAKFLRYEML